MKNEQMEFPETLQEAITYFSDETRAFDFMVSFRWKAARLRALIAKANGSRFLPRKNAGTAKTAGNSFPLKSARSLRTARSAITNGSLHSGLSSTRRMALALTRLPAPLA